MGFICFDGYLALHKQQQILQVEAVLHTESLTRGHEVSLLGTGEKINQNKVITNYNNGNSKGPPVVWKDAVWIN